MAGFYKKDLDVSGLSRLIPAMSKSPLESLGKSMTQLDTILTNRDKEQYSKKVTEDLGQLTSSNDLQKYMMGLDRNRLTDAASKGIDSNLSNAIALESMMQKDRQIQLEEAKAQDKTPTNKFGAVTDAFGRTVIYDKTTGEVKQGGGLSSLGQPTTGSSFPITSKTQTKELPTGEIVYISPDGSTITDKATGKPIVKDYAKTSQASIEENKVTRKNLKSANRDSFMGLIDKLDTQVNKDSLFTPISGILGAMSQFIPGSERERGEDILRGIEANLAFENLQAMRDASPTGGALGQVSNIELELLKGKFGAINLNQKPEYVAKQLEDLKKTYDEVINGVANRATEEIDGVEYNTATVAGVESIQNPRTGKWFPKEQLMPKGK